MFKWKLIRFTTLRKDCTFQQTIETHFQTSRNCCLVHVDTVDWLILLGYKLISKPCTLHVFTWLIDNIREQDLSGNVGMCHVLWFETVSRPLIWNCVSRPVIGYGYLYTYNNIQVHVRMHLWPKYRYCIYISIKVSVLSVCHL